MTRVLPEPAPATTSSGAPGCRAASSCAGFSSRASVSGANGPGRARASSGAGLSIRRVSYHGGDLPLVEQTDDARHHLVLGLVAAHAQVAGLRARAGGVDLDQD